MDEYAVPLIAALLGFLAAVLASALTGRHQARESRRQEARLAIADLIKNAEVASHNITWFTWQAKYRADHLGAEHALSYDDSMNEIYRNLTASLAVVAAHSDTIYKQFRDLVKRVYDLDDKVAQAATALLEEHDDAPSAIGGFYQEARQLEDEIAERGIALMATIR